MISKAEHDAALAEKQEQIDALKQRLEKLERMLFGDKSERTAPASAPESKKKATHQRKKGRAKPHPGRAKLPDHLPVRQVII